MRREEQVMTKDEIIDRVEKLGFSIKGSDDEQIVSDMVDSLVVLKNLSYEEAIQEVLFLEGVE